MKEIKELIYRFKPSHAQIGLINELKVLEKVEGRTEQQEERKQQLEDMRISVQDWRFTFATCNALQNARYQSNLRRTRRWFEEETGVPPSEFLDEADKESDEYMDMLTILNMGHAWASTMASIVKYEVRTVILADAIDGEPWIEQPIPSEWKDLSAYLSDIPADLIWELETAANAVNPNLWHVKMDDASKKFGVLSES